MTGFSWDTTTREAERVYLAGWVGPGEEELAAEHLDELQRLAETAGGRVVGASQQRRPAPDPTSFLGRGKVDEIAADARRCGATLLIMDNDLSPAQARNIEAATDLRVVDRSQLIMDIFAAGARTLQAKKQVELAQLEYTLPRLKHMWSHLSRIRSGIGMRGPGETQLEVDRRIIRRKIGELKRSLREFDRRKQREIEARDKFFKVCLVGYTNSGKSTLINRLTGAGVKVEDRLFSTLDTRTRKWQLDDSLSVLLSDTVGFIRKLPHHLVASFHATLEEASTADLLLHVVDCSRGETATRNIDAVNEVLADLGVAGTPQILVFNKVDLVTDFMEVSALGRGQTQYVLASAATGVGIDGIAEAVLSFLLKTLVLIEVRLPVASGRLRAFIAERGKVESSVAVDGVENVRVRLPRFEIGRLREIAAAESASIRVLHGGGHPAPEEREPFGPES